MARPRQKKTVVPRSRKQQPDPYTARINKGPSQRELEDTLRHAVRNHDFDALEDYDEENPRPPTGAVAPPKDELADYFPDDNDDWSSGWDDLEQDFYDWSDNED